MHECLHAVSNSPKLLSLSASFLIAAMHLCRAELSVWERMCPGRNMLLQVTDASTVALCCCGRHPVPIPWDAHRRAGGRGRGQRAQAPGALAARPDVWCALPLCTEQSSSPGAAPSVVSAQLVALCVPAISKRLSVSMKTVDAITVLMPHMDLHAMPAICALQWIQTWMHRQGGGRHDQIVCGTVG